MNQIQQEIEINPNDINTQMQNVEIIRRHNLTEMQQTGRQKLAMTVTMGCQQNEADTEKLRGMLEEMGFGFTENEKEADLVILNTCCVRENAELKVFGNLGQLKSLKEQKPHLLIGICGCMTQQQHIVDTIRNKYQFVSFVLGTQTIHRFPEILLRAMEESGLVVEVDEYGSIVEQIPVRRTDPYRAWVSVMYGCNNFCSYCIVPYVRGRERSRKPEDILSEIRGLAEAGYREVTLLGQNVNSYGKDLDEKITFADLIRKVNEIEGISRIRFLTSHPKDISDDLIYAMRDCEKVCRMLHLPVQSGSNKVLKDMNRHYTREKYLDIVRKLKHEMPDIALTSDIIVGFPTETRQDFEDTLELVKEVRYDSLFTFIYSPRKGTPAEKLQILQSPEEIHRNFDELVAVQSEISLEINKGYVGKKEEVLVEGCSKTRKDVLTGRTRTGKIVNFPIPETDEAAIASSSINGIENEPPLTGKLVEVEITSAQTYYLSGRYTRTIS